VLPLRTLKKKKEVRDSNNRVKKSKLGSAIKRTCVKKDMFWLVEPLWLMKVKWYMSRARKKKKQQKREIKTEQNKCSSLRWLQEQTKKLKRQNTPTKKKTLASLAEVSTRARCNDKEDGCLSCSLPHCERKSVARKKPAMPTHKKNEEEKKCCYASKL
jgi:hypothetical protein